VYAEENSFGPVLDFFTNESSILLCQKPAKVCIGEATYTGRGEVRLDLAPRAHIHLYGTFQNIPPKDVLMAMSAQEKNSTFHIDGHNVQGFPLNIGHNSDQEMTVKWCPKSEPVNAIGDESTQMNRLVFHLFNFKDILGTRRSSEKRETTTCAINHVDLSCDDWKVQLRSLFETSDNFKQLESEGGYRLTHVGCLQKNNDTAFSGKEADEMLDALRFFFSFAKAAWCEPVCPVGFDKSDNRVWESWSSPREPWHTPSSWFDPHHSSQLEIFFPSFIKCWKDKDWRKALHEVIYWYLSSNYSTLGLGIGIDAGIILTQAAIERLSSEYAVKYKRLIEAEGFKNLKASDKFRCLFSSLDIPIDIPSQTSELLKLAKANDINWIDAPHALTVVRNSLLHPDHKHRGKFDSAFYEAWKLGLWYLELSILRICRYSGSYSNRLKGNKWVGTVENVPWG